MYTTQLDYGARSYPAQSNLSLIPVSILVLSIHHSFHPHEHSAQ